MLLAEESHRQRAPGERDAFALCLVDLERVRRHLGARAPVDDGDVTRAEPQRLTRDVDRGVAAADDDDAIADLPQLVVLQGLDERERLPDAGEVVARELEWTSSPIPTPRKTASYAESASTQLTAVPSRNRTPSASSARAPRGAGRARSGTARSRSGRDRRSRPALEDGDGVAASRQLAGAGEPGRAGADDGHRASRRRRQLAGAAARGRAPSRSRSAEARRSRTGSWPSCARTQAPWHSTSTGQTRAHVPPRMFSAKIVCAAAAVSSRKRIDESGHVDARRASHGAGRGRVRPAALEAAVGLEQGVLVGERRPELTGQTDRR